MQQPATFTGTTNKKAGKEIRKMFLRIAKKILRERPLPEMWTEADEQMLARTQYYIGESKFVTILNRPLKRRVPNKLDKLAVNTNTKN